MGSTRTPTSKGPFSRSTRPISPKIVPQLPRDPNNPKTDVWGSAERPEKSKSVIASPKKPDLAQNGPKMAQNGPHAETKVPQSIFCGIKTYFLRCGSFFILFGGPENAIYEGWPVPWVTPIGRKPPKTPDFGQNRGFLAGFAQ